MQGLGTWLILPTPGLPLREAFLLFSELSGPGSNLAGAHGLLIFSVLGCITFHLKYVSSPSPYGTPFQWEEPGAEWVGLIHRILGLEEPSPMLQGKKEVTEMSSQLKKTGSQAGLRSHVSMWSLDPRQAGGHLLFPSGSYKKSLKSNIRKRLIKQPKGILSCFYRWTLFKTLGAVTRTDWLWVLLITKASGAAPSSQLHFPNSYPKQWCLTCNH